MNRASRDKDLDKIEFYGPLASALGYILHAASSKRKELGNKVTLYRGFSLKEEDIKNHYEVGKDTNLLGFTSTTLKRSIAINFAIPSSDLIIEVPEKTPILLVIEFTGKQQYFFLNSGAYSAYPDEQEVLLQDGI
jgi:hypothetical protein